MSIVFLQKSNCPYTVHFNVYEENINILQKIKICTQRLFQLISVFFIALKESVCGNLQGIKNSELLILSNIYVAAFTIVFWITIIGWGTLTTTVRLFKEKTFSNFTVLKQFADNEINVNHIKTEEVRLDASSVPANIKVDDLKDIFKKINFTDKNAPGYMAPETRREMTGMFSSEELEGNLEKFIQRVGTREAFLGTPPSHDLPQLMDFYQQIEDAVRLSIYKTTEDVAEFEIQNGIAFPNFSIEQKRKYNNLLERRARLVLDLAVAGAHCGARYMGEAMEAYYGIYSRKGIPNDKDLQGTLIEILAKKREELAKEQIQRYLGSNELGGVNAHLFTKYMGTMGKLLGIPGTKNIIEHLSRGIDVHQMLNYFFQEYTVDTIIDTIQEKIKTSKTFREKIIDWIKDQVKDWNHEKYENVDTIVERIKEFQRSNLETPASARNFKIIQEVLFDLKEEKVALPKINGDWNDFLIELFALSKFKDKIIKRFPKENEESELQYRIRINTLKGSYSEAMLGPDLLKALQDAIESDNFTPIPLDRYLPRFMEKAEIEKMKAILANEYEIPMEQDTLARVLKGKVSLKEAIQNQQELARRNEFLSCFDLEEIAEQGLSKELMEWILVSQKILKPQIEIESDLNLKQANEGQMLSYINIVHQGFKENPRVSTEAKDQMPLERLLKLLRTKDENVEDFSSYIETLHLNEKRYRQNTEKEKILTQIFNQSFQHDSAAVITAAEKASGTAKSFYPKWKKICWIQLPKSSVDLFSNGFFKTTLMISAVALSIFLARQLFVDKGIPFIINQIPRAGNAFKGFIKEHSFIILSTLLTIKIIKMLPEIPYLSAAARAINVWKVFVIYSFKIILEISIDSLRSYSWHIIANVKQRFLRISENAEKDRLMICRQRSFSVWKGCQVALA